MRKATVTASELLAHRQLDRARPYGESLPNKRIASAMSTFFKLLLLMVAAALATLAGVLGLGTAPAPAELISISAPFKSVDFSDLPPLQRLEVAASSGPLAYRRYGKDGKFAVIALHGSTASSASLHPLAKRLTAEGMAVYVPDLRGHGETGKRGDIDNTNRMLMDIDMLISRVRLDLPEAEVVLAGFSAGGGLALHFGGSPMGHAADKYVLIAPALGRGAPTTKAARDPWAVPHIPRITALSLLNSMGITAFDGLEAIRFAVPANAPAVLTPAYSFRMLKGMLPTDYADDLRRIVRPTIAVLAEKDELFDAATLRKTLNDVRTEISVTVVPGINHIGLSLDPAGHTAIVQAIRNENLEDRPEPDDSDGTKNPALQEVPKDEPGPGIAPPRPQ